jgi:cytochrome c553
MTHARRRLLFDAIVIGVALAATTLLVGEAAARRDKTATPASAVWQAECGSCHVPYPPRLLPARSWRALMDGLERHFGTDASIDAVTAASIRSYLETNAGRERSPTAPPVLRITETRWFVREHGDVPATTWRKPEIGSAANCGACHADAQRGRFGEHDVRIPR